MTGVSILGSTGSIGTSALSVIRASRGMFRVAGLSAKSNIRELEKQIREFKPRCAAVVDPKKAGDLKKRISDLKTEIIPGSEGLERLASLPAAGIVLVCTAHTAGLMPSFCAVRAGKRIAIANKEPLVMAGSLLSAEAKKRKVQILPLDSEHSAIFQCLKGSNHGELRRILLTASGGPFLNTPAAKLSAVTPEQALRHPRWRMGAKVTIDSATMMNKGLEILEAMVFFGTGPEKIDVLIHPEAIVHSLVEFVDGNLLAQLGITDMRLPIQYALTYPRRLPSGLKPLDLPSLGKLTFFKPDFRKFPALKLCYEVGKEGGTLPAVLNGADDVAVDMFIRGRIRFTDIAGTVSKVAGRHRNRQDPALEDILNADRWAREETLKLCRG